MKKNLFVILTFAFVIIFFSTSAQVDIDKPVNLSGSSDSDRAITNLAPPVNGTDAVNKDYVDGLSGGTIHYVGELYGGGLILAVWSEAGVQKGLVVSSVDVSASAQWSGNIDNAIGVTAQSFTDGQSNTNAIISQSGGGNTAGKAATLCDAYTNTDTGTGVFSDWYLPSMDELGLCYLNKWMITTALGPGGEFQAVKYWSSTEHDGGTSAWQWNFNTGTTNNEGKGNSFRVRAVRKF